MTTQEFIDQCNQRGHYPDCPVHEDVTTEKCCALRYAVERINERDAEVQGKCKWTYKWQVWNTGCGESFGFDLPQTVDVLYCPKCRKPITTKQEED